MLKIDENELSIAKLNLDIMSDQLDKIYAVASNKMRLEETLADDRDINLITLLDVICGFASDAKAYYSLEAFFNKHISG